MSSCQISLCRNDFGNLVKTHSGKLCPLSMSLSGASFLHVHVHMQGCMCKGSCARVHVQGRMCKGARKASSWQHLCPYAPVSLVTQPSSSGPCMTTGYSKLPVLPRTCTCAHHLPPQLFSLLSPDQLQ